MPWQTPVTNWDASKIARPSDFNRVEGNIVELKKAATIDIDDSGSYFMATNVEGALQELAGNISTGKNSLVSAIMDMGQTADSSMTFAELAAKIRAISTDATADISNVLSGKTFYAGGQKRTGAMPNKGAVNISPGTADQIIPEGYHNGQGKVLGDPDLVSGNIRPGKDIFGVAGSFTNDANATSGQILSSRIAYVKGNKITGTMPNRGTQTITPGTSDQALSGYYASGSKVVGDPDLIPANIVQDKQIFGVTGSAFSHKFARYAFNVVKFEQRPVSGKYLTVVRVNSDGSYCVAFGDEAYMVLYKRIGESWSVVFEGFVGATDYQDASWSPDGTYLLAVDRTYGVACLIKRVGDTLSYVSEATGMETAAFPSVSCWDDAGIYCVVRDRSYLRLVKRTGDAIAFVSSLYSQAPSRTIYNVSGDANLRYIVTAYGTALYPRLVERSGDTLVTRYTGTSTAEPYYIINREGSYVLGMYRSSVRLYRRDGNTLTRIAGTGGSVLDPGLGMVPEGNTAKLTARITEDGVYPMIFDRVSDENLYVPLVAVIGIDSTHEKARCIVQSPQINFWGGSFFEAAQGLSADYSADGQYLVLVGERDPSGNDPIFFIKVGE